MRRLRTRIKPKRGVANILHIGLNILLPVLAFMLVRITFVPLAIALVICSKWRMFAVKPRYWLANIRSNAIDIIVGVSLITFMAHAPSQAWQVVWAATYAAWLIFIKPRSTAFWVSIQAMAGQLLGLTAIYMTWGRAPLLSLVVVTWGVCYLAGRHFFSSYDEPLTALLSQLWGYFGAALTWVLGHWLLYYGAMAQPVLFLSVIGFGLAILYYLETNDRLSVLVRRQIILIMTAVIFVLIIFSDWGDKAI
jgi:hypothetical protein